MDLKERNTRIGEYYKEQMDLLDRKGADYAGGKATADANLTFKEVARRLAGAPLNAMTVAAVYFEKHIMSLETFIRTGRLESEGLEGRFNDIANYANIMRSLHEEMIAEHRPTKKTFPSIPATVEVETVITSNPELEYEAEKVCAKCGHTLSDHRGPGLACLNIVGNGTELCNCNRFVGCTVLESK